MRSSPPSCTCGRSVAAWTRRPPNRLVEGYADVIADELAKNRELGLGLTYAGINAGVADFWPVDDGTEAILALSIDIGSWLI
jgi:hypothetical protein